MTAAAPAQGAPLIFQLFVMFAGAKLLAEAFCWLRQPAVVGEIIAGVLIGPHVLGWVAPSETSRLLAEIGVIFLLFGVGLETRPEAILKVGRVAFVVAVLGVALPFAAGLLLVQSLGGSLVQALFAGAAMVATSVGITARVLGGMGLLDSTPARVILAAAVIDDVLGLLVLAAVAGAAQGGVRLGQIGATAGLATAFVAAIAIFGAPMMTRAAGHFHKLRAGNEFFVIAVVLCFGLALGAAYIGVAAIVGAFLAGLAMADTAERRPELRQQVRGAAELLAPFFLVNIGMQLDLGVFADRDTLLLAGAITVLAIVTKIVGCGLGARSLGWRGALQVGVGMVPRGEVGIVVAQIGLGMGTVDNRLYAAVLFMACATTLLAPPMMRPAFAVRIAEAEAEQAQSEAVRK
ncbi:MAG: cation:proton antiporter [Nevskia sp.]|nr:cation:proton antiporter [Nevskia sp.]